MQSCEQMFMDAYFVKLYCEHLFIMLVPMKLSFEQMFIGFRRIADFMDVLEVCSKAIYCDANFILFIRDFFISVPDSRYSDGYR